MKKAVHFGWVRRIPEENEEEEELEEKAVATLSLSVQVPTAGGKAMGEKWWREQSSMSQLLENLRPAAEVFADPKAENEVFQDKRGVEATERVVRKVESIFKKPHRAAGKLTLSERKFVEETGVDGNELYNEKVPVEAEDVLELPKVEKKRVRLTVCVSPEEGREKKKSVKKKEEKIVDGSSGDAEVVQQVSHLRRNVVEIGDNELDLRWDPGAFEMEHMSMEVAPRCNPMEGWFKKDVVQPMAAWAEFTPYLASVASVKVMGPPKRDGVLDGGSNRGQWTRKSPAAR